MASEHMIRLRLIILPFTLVSLAIALLSSANAYFAVILRDRVRSDFINTTDDILDNKFQSIQSSVLIYEAFAALGSSLIAILGAVIMVYTGLLRLLRDNCFYCLLLLVPALVMITLGGCVTDQVHGYQTSFEKFDANDSIPYYDIMYYGGVAQAAYGSALFFLTTFLCIKMMKSLVAEDAREAAAADNSMQEFAQVYVVSSKMARKG